MNKKHNKTCTRTDPGSYRQPLSVPVKRIFLTPKDRSTERFHDLSHKQHHHRSSAKGSCHTTNKTATNQSVAYYIATLSSRKISSMKIQLSLSAQELRNKDFTGTSDPFATVTWLSSVEGTKPAVLGRTET